MDCREAIVEFLLGRCGSFADEEAEVSRAEHCPALLRKPLRLMSVTLCSCLET
jgi:hypothetical protein